MLDATLSREIRMRMNDVGTALRRRWYLTLVGLLATVVVVLGVMRLVPATFQTQANVVLLPPQSSVGQGGNPYLYLGGLQQASDILTRALTSDDARTKVKNAVNSVDYDVLPDATTSGPVLIVTARGKTQAAANGLRQTVLDAVPTTLVQLQDTLNVPSNARITSMVLTADDVPKPVTKTQMRASIAAGALAAVMFAMLIGLFDGLATARRQRKALAQQATTFFPVAPPAEPAGPVSDAATLLLLRARLGVPPLGSPRGAVDDLNRPVAVLNPSRPGPKNRLNPGMNVAERTDSEDVPTPNDSAEQPAERT
jgi:hypothetical protein